MTQKNKRFRWAATAVFGLWICMMLLLIQREYFPTIGSVEANYEEILKKVPRNYEKIKRQKRVMEVYYTNSIIPIGEIQSITTSLPDGTFELSTRAKLEVTKEQQGKINKLTKFIQVPGKQDENLKVMMESTAVVGPDYQLQNLDFRVKANLFDIACEGKIRTGKLIFALKQGGKEAINREVPLPRGTVAMNQLEAMPIPQKIKVGQRFHMRWFDPLTQTHRNVKSRVIGKEKIVWGGKSVETFVIHSDSGAFKTISWVDENNQVLRYQIAGFTFKLKSEKPVKNDQETIEKEQKND
ncbi:hypothetical protein [Candidatus Uabimicrobium amorphum]|uniref:Uncharacterized protein n=1 Tax=Uabimicrobium amorphum TaxID=2596890 RepID=A0A5S9IV23_UABAM|nr:hypothetical protein [Candidatus Uabimicrobium amorphum]BBM87851.1 hypothetical protein UABAM_06266 [Candidatus Uabimicrobium amorphum]